MTTNPALTAAMTRVLRRERARATGEVPDLSVQCSLRAAACRDIAGLINAAHELTVDDVLVLAEGWRRKLSGLTHDEAEYVALISAQFTVWAIDMAEIGEPAERPETEPLQVPDTVPEFEPVGVPA